MSDMPDGFWGLCEDAASLIARTRSADPGSVRYARDKGVGMCAAAHPPPKRSHAE